ncbi:NAD(P)-dependent oxidoreductase [Ferruginibacter paludis]|uniref:NAD(P)-dependent oxidoreductase n=1 Tax=Ferruginibacter paludis TaxID=1310417 RepID=UPI0025B3A510|nr:NAD(P)-dependent oxidoreductase [Ferruginibacter paludis]MDN3654684.1 NAD(P)-dependent oxidoreductase [Ferruginibacter paludis]
MSKPKIGWVGLGNMGLPMAKNLLKAGFEVTVFNRTKSKEQALIEAGASAAESLQQLVQHCDIIITILSDDAAVKVIFEGTNGLLSKPQPGKLFIDMSTVAPETSCYLAGICARLGLGFIEAPVSGSVKPAQDGTLIILVGGSAENYEKAKPVFDVLGKLSLLLGESGKGSTAKLAINYLLALNLQGLAETVLFAEKNGISKQDMLTIVNEGACANGITKLKSASILNDDYPAAFALKHLVKDLRLAKEAGLDAPLITPLYDAFNKAQQAGFGNEDVMAIKKYLESNQ